MLLRPLADTLRVIGAAPGVWLFLILLTAIYGGQQWLMLSAADSISDGAVAASTIGFASLLMSFVMLFIDWFLIRSFGGPGLPRGRFWPWLGIMLAANLAFALVTAAVALGYANIGAANFAFVQNAVQLVLWAVLMPLYIWATACALGHSAPFQPMRMLPAPGYLGYVISYFAMLLVLKLGALAGGAAVMAGVTDTPEIAALITGLFSAAISLADIAFTVAAAKAMNGNDQQLIDVFC
jgi:hypothetical protein